MASRKHSKKRGYAWSDEETLTLISIWDEQAIEEQIENPKINNGSIYKSVSDEMTDKGFEKTPEQCKVRIHTLKRMYREAKTKLKKSGKGRKTCKFFAELDSILGNRPASSPLKVIESMSKKRSLECEDASESSDTGSIDAGIRPLESIDDSDDESSPNTNTKGNKEDKGLKEATDTGNKEDKEPKEATNTGKKEDNVIVKEKKSSSGNAKETSKTTEKRDVTEKREKKRVRKSKLEVALTSVMDGFSTSNEKAEDKFLDLERRKLELEKQKVDMEKLRMESEERQKREERKHQFDMMQMIMGVCSQRQAYPPSASPYATGSQMMGGQGTSQMSSPNMPSQQFSGANQFPQYQRQSPGIDEDSTYYNL